MVHSAELPAPSRLIGQVLDLLEIIEATDASGEIVVEHDGIRRGTVFVESGRVCWAAARGLERRLSDLLRMRIRTPTSRTEMEALVRSGRKHQQPLSELLVGSGLMERNALQYALRQHTTESMIALGERPGVARFVARESNCDDALCSLLRPVEVAAYVGAALDDRNGGDIATALIERGIETGAAFVRRGDAVLPIASIGIPTVQELRHLGREVAIRFEVAHMMDSAASFVFVGQAQQGLVAWGDSSMFLVSKIHERADFVRAIGRFVTPGAR